MQSVGESVDINGVTHELIIMPHNEQWHDIAWRIAYEDYPIKLNKDSHIGDLYWVPYYSYHLRQIREGKINLR